MRIGFIGLGIMGSRMAANFRAKGHELWVHNRTRDRAKALLDAGAQWSASPRAMAEVPGIELICTCVADPPAMEETAYGAQGFVPALAKGTRVVDFSTMFPDLIRRLGADVAARGGALLESPMTGSKNGAQAGTLLLMCGGERALFDELQPVLKAVAAKMIYVGSLEARRLAAGQAGRQRGDHRSHGREEALSEGAALLAKSEIPLEKMLEVIQASRLRVAVL